MLISAVLPAVDANLHRFALPEKIQILGFFKDFRICLISTVLHLETEKHRVFLESYSKLQIRIDSSAFNLEAIAPGAALAFGFS
jgi:hypothetical protein